MRLPYLVPGIAEGGENENLRRLEELVDDLRGYGGGKLPSEGDLAAAPLVDLWSTVADLSSVRACGLIVGHPLLGSCFGATSPIHAIARDGRWLRTYSRLYRLGRPGSAGTNRPN